MKKNVVSGRPRVHAGRGEAGCSECGRRPVCRKICGSLEKILKREEGHFHGREILVSPAAIDALFSRPASGSSNLMRDEVRASEVRRIPGLTNQQLRILKMSLVEGKSHKSIASALGINQSTVGQHMTLARRKARRFLEESLRPRARGRKTQPHPLRAGQALGEKAG